MKTLFSVLKTSMNLRSGRRHCLRHRWLMNGALIGSLFAPALAHADAVVTEPTEAALDAALAQVATGGTITFACDGAIPITNTKKIAAGFTTSITVTLDATGHNITLDGGGKTTLFAASGHMVHNYDDTNSRYRASFVFKRLTLTNSAGRAVSANLGNVTASDCAFTNNGSIVVAGGNLNATNCAFTNNTAASGGAAQGSNGTMTASYCTFSNNVASSGGALQGSSLIVTSHCAFLNNRATNGNGGAICNTVNGVSLSDSVFAGNSAEYPGTGASGGAVYYGGQGGANTITRCAFLNNAVSASDTSIVTGGALMADGPLSPTSITNCTFTGNRASGGGAAAGGAIYFLKAVYSSSNGNITNCTIAGNSATGGQGSVGSGGGIYNNMTAFTLINTLVANNTASTSGNNAGGNITDGGHNICSDASCAFTSATSKNNTDPRLGPLVYPGNATPTLSLLGGSPAIDAGDDSKAPVADQRGASVQGSHRDIGAYERPVWQADAVAADKNNNTLLLWNHNQGYVSLWNVNSGTGGSNGQWLYGPYEGWTCVDMAVGADSKARLLWRYTDGRLAVWGVNASTGAVLYQRGIAAEAGWTGLALRMGTDGNARLAWRYGDGRICVWTLDENTGMRLNASVFTPGSGYTFADFATGLNNRISILWNNSDGTQNVSSVDAGGSLISSYNFGPYAGWTATRLSVGSDNQTRLLWNHVQGYQCLWSVDGNGSVNSQTLYGAQTGWNCLALATGSDNNTRLLWNHVQGYQSLWGVDSAFNIQNQFLYGPYY